MTIAQQIAQIHNQIAQLQAQMTTLQTMLAHQTETLDFLQCLAKEQLAEQTAKDFEWSGHYSDEEIGRREHFQRRDENYID